MKAAVWTGNFKIEVQDKPKPSITNKHDALLRVTSTAICGSDLHLYGGYMPGMEKGDIMGHEFMGIVEDVGEDVTTIKKGDRVVACFDIACGHCGQCNNKLFSECDVTNSSDAQEDLYGHRTAGLFGFSHMTGGYAGGQADFARVPFADVNLIKVPSSLTDQQVLFLSDILCTAWHAMELGEVKKGDVVAIWGAGPVGLLAVQCAQFRGAKRVILIDNVKYRLEYASQKLPGVELLDFGEHNTVKRLKEMVPNGPDVCIEAVGFHYAKTLLSKAEMLVGLQTDPADIINELIISCRKGGIVSIVGVYAATCNRFMIGPLMEKNLTMRAGQTPCQKYWDELLGYIESGKLDPTFIISHEPALTEATKMYKLFNDKQDGCLKVIMHPTAA
ncbi:hypothetical protein WJX84_008344 [Apatococcus fuscideae]|uniref:Alcohol dehydrogenase n=1 Tax=Apatococcus fuscideae TaxID=2026836 RepID=A0AAW1TDQ2_9CHLO